MFQVWDPYHLQRSGHVFPGLDLYHADPAQPVITTGKELDDLDHDLSDLSEVCIVHQA